MDLALSDEQQALHEAVTRMLAKTSSPERVREAEPLGFSEAVWNGFAEMGIPTMGIPDIGGATLADLAVVARAAGAALAPAPVVETMVAHRLLARFVDDPGVEPLPVLALRQATTSHMGVGRRFTLVPGGAVASAITGLASGQLIVIRPADRPNASAPANLGSAPLADIELDTGGSLNTVLAEGPAASAAFEGALDEWRALTAEWLVGLGRAAFDIGVQYVKDRKQFGVAIGSFQSVQHRLADIATNLDGAELLADKAIWALDTGDPCSATFPSMSFANAGEVAEAAAAAALHLHGGYGFMEEYDIQLYFRRAKATRLLLADPRRELQHLADRLFGPVGPLAAAASSD